MGVEHFNSMHAEAMEQAKRIRISFGKLRSGDDYWQTLLPQDAWRCASELVDSFDLFINDVITLLDQGIVRVGYPEIGGLAARQVSLDDARRMLRMDPDLDYTVVRIAE